MLFFPKYMPSPQVSLQSLLLFYEVVVQVYPVSTVHVAEHPSPPTVLPSSHASIPKESPSPHISVHVSAVSVVPPVQA